MDICYPQRVTNFYSGSKRKTVDLVLFSAMGVV